MIEFFAIYREFLGEVCNWHQEDVPFKVPDKAWPAFCAAIVSDRLAFDGNEYCDRTGKVAIYGVYFVREGGPPPMEKGT